MCGWFLGYMKGRFIEMDDRDLKNARIPAILFVTLGLLYLIGGGIAILTEPGKHWYGWRLW